MPPIATDVDVVCLSGASIDEDDLEETPVETLTPPTAGVAMATRLWGATGRSQYRGTDKGAD